MLVTLSVTNFAIIDHLEINFHSGMTVLTGETGAGKSLIIDAIGLLFGKRASNDMIRFNESKATVEGIFSINSLELFNQLDLLGIEYNKDEYLIIKREIYSSGKSICRINNTAVSLVQLSTLSEQIGDIHSQLDTLGLINPKNYLYFLSSPLCQEYLNEYSLSLKEYKHNEKEYNDLIKLNQENTLKKDFLEYQFKELKQANISIDEEKSLKEELSYLSHYEQIVEQIHSFKDLYDDNDILSKIYDSINYLNKLITFDEKYQSLKDIVEESYYNLDNVLSDPLFKINNIQFDENRLNEINERLSVYSDLKRKYKKNTDEIIEYYHSIEKTLQDIDNYDSLIQELQNKTNQSFHKVLDIAKNISNERKNVASQLTTKVEEQLADLQLKNTKFNIEFHDQNLQDTNNINFYKDGIDNVDFMVSFNKGEPLKPLSKVVSGGEMSRFMLALKTILGNKMPLQTKIFDEVDTGVSGVVAYSIAKKIKTISEKSQVLCVTHLSQVAAIGDHHLKIAKSIVDGRTITEVKELTNDERIEEIATMISNGKPSLSSREVAKELLNNITNI